MYSGNVNVVCVSPDGNVYATMPFYGGNLHSAPQPPPTANFDRSTIANIGPQFSVDPNGSDLPYADVATLRYYYNLGLEYSRICQMWGTNCPPLAYSPGFMPQTNVPALPPIETPPPEIITTPPANPPRQNYPQTRRKPEQVPANPQGRPSNNAHATPRNFPRRESQEGHKGRNEQCHSPNEFVKPKNSNANKDYNHGNWEPQRRNPGNNRFRKNNEGKMHVKIHTDNYDNKLIIDSMPTGRNRNDRPSQYGLESHQRSINPPQGNKTPIFTNSDAAGHFQRGKQDSGYAVQQINSPQPPVTPSPPFQPHYNQPQQQQQVYTNVQCYSNDGDTFYPPSPNMYPIPYMAHQEVPEAHNSGPYICNAPENYSQPISPVYTPIPYPPPPLYSVPVPNSQEGWYSVSTQPPTYMHYPHQVPVTQPPPTMVGSPPS